MQTNRRDWLKAVGLLSAGLCLPGISTVASAITPDAATEPAKGPVRLCFNENPYGPPASARDAMVQHIHSSNRYPWETITSLITAVAVKNGLVADNVLVAAGSTQVIDAVIQLAAQQKGSFVLAAPTFGRWSSAAEAAGLRKVEVPLTADKRHDLAAMRQATGPDTRLVYVCNPNNPTGTVCAYDELVSFVKETSKQSLVMIDEAYLDYTDEPSLSSLVKDHENIIVVKTFSKIYGLAGARIGYALAHTKTMERIQQLQSGANMGISAVSLAGAIAALTDTDFVKSSAAMNSECRKFTVEGLERQGIHCIPSHTNFIYFSLSQYKGDFLARLKEHNILGTGIFEENGKWSRITVATRSEMAYFLKAISQV